VAQRKRHRHRYLRSLEGPYLEEFQSSEGLGWGFMYDDLIRINLSMVREFCANFSSGQQEHVFLRGKKIPFTEDNIRHHLGIHRDSPDAEVDDDFVALAKAYERGDDMDMAEIFSMIG
ncbi:hypothetical protein PIB30_082557, partial [Stylosanthes scabra]|nr:hypothetical protein [Stylosanthes scabra]